MSNEPITTSGLERKKKIGRGGREYWMGRDILELLGYADWDNFSNVVKKAIVACNQSGVEATNHFREVTEKVGIGSGAMGRRKTFFLSRYACYLIAMNGDSSKEAIALAQTYFAVQTRRQEIADQLSEEEQRIENREKLRQATKDLNSVAKQSGVHNYGLFQNAGYRGLYGMGLADIKTKKGLKKNDELFDRAGNSELAANLFRASQTAERLEREKVNGEHAATDTHFKVASEVRSTIKKLGNKMPENLPAEPDIKSVKKQLESTALRIQEASETNPKESTGVIPETPN